MAAAKVEHLWRRGIHFLPLYLNGVQDLRQKVLSPILGRMASHHSSFRNQVKGLHNLSTRSFTTSSTLEKYYVKPNYLKKWGRRDMKRRETFKEYEVQRSSLRMIKKSDILPSGVRKRAADEIKELPLNSNLIRVRNRCVITDRGRGNVGRFRVSRMMFRHFAERGQIAGVKKSQW